MHLAREAQGFTEKMGRGVVTSGAPTDGVQGGAQAVGFERKFLARDRMDDEMNTKMQLMDNTGMTPFGQVYYDEKVGRWLERKAAVSEAANFDAFFGEQFNKNDLASRAWAQKINPDWYAAREREMAERAEMVLKLKGIQLRGPQNKEELTMQWLIESGRVKLPRDWDVIGPGYTQTNIAPLAGQNRERFAQGLIRLPLFLTQGQRTVRATTNNSVGAWGSAKEAVNMFTEGEGFPGARAIIGNNPLQKANARDQGTLATNFTQFLGASQQ